MAVMEQVTGYIAGFTLSLVAVYAKNMCTDLNSIPHIEKNSYLTGYTFRTFPDFSLMKCAKECMLRKRCLSFNFNLTSSTCSLNSRNSSDVSVTASATMVYSNMDLWPGRMIGECEGHSCKVNERCNVFGDDVPTCVITGCLEPPAILNGNIDTMGKVLWNLLEIQSYTCQSVKFSPQGTLQCKADGTWSVVKCRWVEPDD